MLALSERGRRETTREEIIELLGAGPKAADHVIESLRRKGWLESATWEAYLKHLIELMAELEAERIGFQSVTESIDTTTPGGKLVFHIFAALTCP